MRFTARARLETWAHASRVQSDEDTYDLERTVVGSVVAGVTADRCGQCGACDRALVPLAVGNRKVGDVEMIWTGKDVRATSAGMRLDDNLQDLVDLLRLTAGGNDCSYAAQGASEIERLREVVTACHQALFQAQEAAKLLLAKGEMLAAVVQGAKDEFVRVPYGASHEDVAAINDWHKMAAEALAAWENKT